MSLPTWDPAAYVEMVQNVVPNSRHTKKPPRKFLFSNTVDVLKAGGYALADGREVMFGEDTERMMAGTIVYSEKFDVSGCQVCGQTKMWVEKQDCLLIGKRLQENGLRPAVLNYADQERGCGDVHNGVDGQQQDLLRRTDMVMAHAQLFKPVWAKRVGVEHKGNVFPLDSRYGCIYTPGVSVFRHNLFYAFDFVEKPYKLDIISCGAVNRAKDCATDEECVDMTRERMRTIFRVGLANGNDSLVLGGWGCSSFRNGAVVISKLFKEVAEEPEFKNKYKVIVFSCVKGAKRGRPYGDLQPFADVFGTEGCM